MSIEVTAVSEQGLIVRGMTYKERIAFEKFIANGTGHMKMRRGKITDIKVMERGPKALPHKDHPGSLWHVGTEDAHPVVPDLKRFDPVTATTIL